MSFVIKKRKIFTLAFCVILQVHLSLLTVENVFNPVTLMYLFYYSPPFSNWDIEWFPRLFIFTFHSIITYYILRILFNSVNWHNFLIAYIICFFVIIVFYLNEQRFEKFDFIYNMDISRIYYKVYNYGSAFYKMVGYLVAQTLLLSLYQLIEVNFDDGKRR